MDDAPQPTQQDRDNAECRRRISERQRDQYVEAFTLAMSALGPGFRPWMKLSLIPSDHRQTGCTDAVATCFKVYRGEEKLSENSMFVRRMPDGTLRSARSYEELFGELLTQAHPSRTLEIRGEKVPAPRWTLTWAALELYSPKDAQGLAELRVSREKGKARREREAFERDNPLLSWADRNSSEEDQEHVR